MHELPWIIGIAIAVVWFAWCCVNSVIAREKGVLLMIAGGRLGRLSP